MEDPLRRMLASLRKRLACGCLAAFALGFVAPAAPARAAETPDQLPAFLSETGPAAFIGKTVEESLRLIEAMVNAAGGVAGRQIHFVVTDPQSNPTVAIQLFNGLQSSGVTALFGPGYTAECNALYELIRNGPVAYCIASGIHPAPGSFMFSGGVATSNLALALATYLRASGWHKIAEISSTDSSGADLEKSFDDALSVPDNRSLSLVAREHFALADSSVAAQVARMKSATPDIAIVWTSGTGFGTVLRGMSDGGLATPVVGGYGNMVRAQIAQYRSFLPATLLFPGILGMAPATGVPAAVHAAQDRYFRAYAKAGTKPDLPGALAWDPTLLILDAYRANGWAATAEQIRAWIASQHAWPGVNGVYDFVKYPQRGLGIESAEIFRWDPQTSDFVPISKPGGAPLR